MMTLNYDHDGLPAACDDPYLTWDEYQYAVGLLPPRYPVPATQENALDARRLEWHVMAMKWERDLRKTVTRLR